MKRNSSEQNQLDAQLQSENSQTHFGKDVESMSVKRPYLRLVGIAFCLAGIAYFIKYIALVNPTVPYMDSLKWIGEYGQHWQSKPLTVLAAWNQGQQSGLIDPFFEYVGMSLWSDIALYSCLLTSFVLVAIYWLFFRNGLKYLDGSKFGVAVGTIFAAGLAACVFSLNGWELYCLTMSLPETLRNLIYLAMGSWTLRVLSRRDAPLKIVIVNAVVQVFTIVVIGMGEVYGYAAALLFCLVLALYRRGADGINIKDGIVIGAPVLGLAIYILLKRWVGAAGGTGHLSLSGLVSLPQSIARSVISSEAATYYHFSAGGMSAIGGVVLLMYALGAAFVLLDRRESVSFGFFSATFGLAVMGSICVARASAGPGAFGASRYYNNLIPLYAGLLLLWVHILVRLGRVMRNGRRSLRYGGLAVFLSFVVFGVVLQNFSNRVEWGVAPYRAASFKRFGKIVLCSDEITPSEANELQANNVVIAQRGVATMRKFGLGPFAVAGARNLTCSAR